MTDQDVLDLVRAKCERAGVPWRHEQGDHPIVALAVNALAPLVEALVATTKELGGYAIASETVKVLNQGEAALADLQAQLQEQADG